MCEGILDWRLVLDCEYAEQSLNVDCKESEDSPSFDCNWDPSSERDKEHS